MGTACFQLPGATGRLLSRRVFFAPNKTLGGGAPPTRGARPARLIRSTLIGFLVLAFTLPARAAEEIYPKHLNAKAVQSINRGLEFLAKTQNQDGYWSGGQEGAAYPVSMASLAGMAFLSNGNTPTRGKYAENVRKVMEYLISNAQASGIITSASQEQGRPMYGHGFAMLFLASVHGMENDEKVRERLKKIIVKGIDLTARGQSNLGGWTYTPGAGDEGSVTVTQMQGLRAAQNAGFTVPKATVEEAVRYLERCRTPEGGIYYSFGSRGDTRLAISAAAIATLYNAGDYDSKLANDCLEYVVKKFTATKSSFSKGGGHDYYCHFYAAQAFYQAGDKFWDDYFPGAREQFISQQAQDGSWTGDGIGKVYGTSIALVVLQLPYKFLPIYQR